MDKLYLITGAAGHLGTAVIKKLFETGAKIRALCLPDEKDIPQGVEICHGNVCDRDSMKDFFKDADKSDSIVIHCAGIVSISSKFLQKVYDVNVGGTKNVVDMSEAAGVGKMIHVSSVHAIPEKNAGEVIAETSDFDPKMTVGLYAQTKAEATAYVLDKAKGGFDAEVVFPSGIIGPYDHGKSHTNTLISDYLSRRLTSAVKGGYDFIDVRDVADGIISCAKQGRRGEGYILSGGYHSIKEILYILHEQTGQKEIKTFLPVWFVNMTAPLCELYYKILREPPLFTRYSIYTLSTNSNFSHEKATRELDFHPRDIRETLADTVAWLCQTGRLQLQT